MSRPLRPARAPISTPSLPRPDTLDVVLSRIRLENGEGLTPTQIESLVELRLANGEPLLSLTDRPSLYETLGLISKIGWNDAYAYLSQPHTDRKTMVMDFPTHDDIRTRVLFDLENYRNQIPPSKGIYKCRKCGSDETITVEKQTRSADEPTTIRITCIHCQATWRIQ